MKKYFETLGLKEGASQEEIQAAYDKLSKELDPEKNENQDFFIEEYKKVQAAYKALYNTSILATEQGAKGSGNNSGRIKGNSSNNKKDAVPKKRISKRDLIKIIIAYVFFGFVILGIIMSVSYIFRLNLIDRDYSMFHTFRRDGNVSSSISLFFGLLAITGTMLLGQVNKKE